MKTITFEDMGQDFLEWDIDDKLVVVGCRPFQASVWVGTQLLELPKIRTHPKIKLKYSPGKETTLNYEVIKIVNKKQPQI